ncbi:cytochrome P450 [Streptomyces albiaxialis]|uniref:Cytochrome P450 n=1 Tax=Streptomyces albiaxialis TaxID=329523 RepID=A0ABN2W5D0_9ACTN
MEIRAEAEAASAAPLPEADPALVERWGAGGGALVDLLTEVRGRYGGVAAFRLGPARTVLVTEPHAVQHVLARRPEVYVKRSHRARLLVGDGVLSATGPAWKRQRRLLQHQFTGPGMRRHERRIEEAARCTAERWEAYARSGEPLDVGREMHRFALDTIWRTLTGRPLDEDTEHELNAVQAVAEVLPTLPADTGDAREAVADELARIDAVAHRAMAEARAGETGDLLRVLTDAAEEHPEYTDQLVRDELVTLLAAGHETTATTLTWLYLLLDRHPEAREQALAAGPEGSPERRKAIQALVQETLRLYPSAWILPRHAAESDTLAGYAVEAGADLLVCPYLTHRDPALWPDPERFDPGRFRTPDARPAHPGAYYPFGLGPRACLGTQFALRESTSLLERLLPAHTPAFHATPTTTSFGFTVRPKGPTEATLSR